MNILSLFDGMSCGRVALERASIPVNTYYSSEVDKYAIQIADKNYPQDTPFRLGDVTKIDLSTIPKIDLLIGGSPCQGFSFAGKQLNFNDPRSKLFFEFVKAVEELNPKYFLLENVRMKKEYQDIITQYLGVEPIMINSSLVSAQNRVRLYWTNIPNVTQPKDLGITLQDICEDIENPGRPCELREFSENTLCHHIANTLDISGNESIKRVYAGTGKAPTLTTMQGGYREPKILIVKEATKLGYTQIHPNQGVDLTFPSSKTRRGRAMRSKSNCLTATAFDYGLWSGALYRKLLPLECERLQTLPDNYTLGVSNSQRYKMLGNGWTVDVIAHIFECMKSID